jgi:NTP pyrophosphatase (non-canonical NTP hydrolase)
MNIAAWQQAVWKVSEDHGWHEDGETSNVAVKLALIHEEVSEALAEYRDTKEGEVLRDVYFDDNGKPCGFGIELADVIIRVLDLAEMLSMDMDHLILVKHMYNDSRPYKHGDRRV